jgi:predicted phosphate transport protein (TIGR00153 family)
MMAILFKPTKQLESQIEEFLNSVSEGAIVFEQGIKCYIEDDSENFSAYLKKIHDLEHKADNLRRTIENMLYTHTLIPEHRGDVLALLENTDNVIDTMKETLDQFDIESPDIPPELEKDFFNLTSASIKAAETLVHATRAFFVEARAVKDHLHKVLFFENEADRIGNNLKRKVFKMEMDLSRKFHLRYFALHIQNVSDRAEEVADRLAIYTIKRTI